jgi:capsule polysaccharide export protein KpsC/LpsZ
MPVVGMFTNLIWDASLEIEEAPFPDVFDWIGRTIELLSGRTDLELVIKTHPAEAMLGTNERVDEWIQEQYAPLPDNVRLLSPEADVNTYQLIKDLDAGIVYNSTVGLEMALEGRPVVVGGDTHYRDLGFTIDAEDPEDYADILSSVTDLRCTDEMRTRARRYGYLLFVRKHFPIFSYGSDDRSLPPVEHEDIAPGASNFDTIVERIVDGDPVLQSQT